MRGYKQLFALLQRPPLRRVLLHSKLTQQLCFAFCTCRLVAFISCDGANSSLASPAVILATTFLQSESRESFEWAFTDATTHETERRVDLARGARQASARSEGSSSEKQKGERERQRRNIPKNEGIAERDKGACRLEVEGGGNGAVRTRRAPEGDGMLRKDGSRLKRTVAPSRALLKTTVAPSRDTHTVNSSRHLWNLTDLRPRFYFW